MKSFFITLVLASALFTFVDPGFIEYESATLPSIEYRNVDGGIGGFAHGSNCMAYFFPNETISFDAKDRNSLVSECLAFIDNHPDIFSQTSRDFELIRAEKRINRWWITFAQRHFGIPVLGGRADFRIYGSGRLAFCGASAIAHFDGRTPLVPYSEAIEIAKNRYAKNGFPTSVKLIYYPVNIQGEIVGSLSWQIDLFESNEKQFRCYISALDAHPIFHYSLVNFYDIWGNANIMFLPLYWDDPMDTAVFATGKVALNYSRTNFTDDFGYYRLESFMTFAMPFTAYLKGLWVDVIDVNGVNGLFQLWVYPPQRLDFVFSPAHADTDELNLYYHTTYIHNYYERLDPPLRALDYPVPARARVSSTPENAFWDGYGTNYGGGGPTTRNFALFANIIYHEYTHGITGWMFEGTYFPYSDQPGAMNEAFSDYFAATICNEPRIGYKCPTIGSPQFRNMNNTLRMPDDWVGQVHSDGRIFGGALWDMRKRIRVSWTDTLVHFTRYATPNTFNGFVPECLFTDDDDDEFLNGTPHAEKIFESFDLHGIGPGTFPKITFGYTLIELGDGDGYFEPGENIRIIPRAIADGSFAWPNIVGLNGKMHIISDWGAEPLDTVSSFASSISAGMSSVGDPFFISVSPSALPHFATAIFRYAMSNADTIIADTLKILIGHPQVLLVDDSPDRGGRIIPFYTNALDSIGVTYKVHRTFTSGPPTIIDDFLAMIWFTGDDTAGVAISPQDTAVIARFIESGGSVLLTGQNLTSQLSTNFLSNRFGAIHRGFSASFVFEGFGAGPILYDGERAPLFGAPGASNQRKMTTISTTIGTPFGRYTNGDTCAVMFDNLTNKTVLFGFGIEGLGGLGPFLKIRTLLERIIRWFDVPITGIYSDPYIPKNPSLLNIMPNPFNSACRIVSPPDAKIEIFDISGRLIGLLNSGFSGEIIWKPPDYLPNGIYLIRAQYRNEIYNARAILIK